MTPDEILAYPARAMTQAQRERYFDEGYVLIEKAIEGALLEEFRCVSLGVIGEFPSNQGVMLSEITVGLYLRCSRRRNILSMWPAP